jgi:phage shock protein E
MWLRALRMDWTPVIIVGGVMAALAGLKQISLARPDKARACLQQGGKVIDVRSPEEYQAGHLDGALNIPLGDLRDQIARHAPDTDQPLLLHCLSGGRSALGRRMLRQMGYRHVFNLGSYRRAEKIVRAAAG